MAQARKKIWRILGSRVARNVYLWIALLYLPLSMNYNNEQEDHYHIIQSPWYFWIISIGLIFQMILVYVNNLVLVPRLLAKGRTWWFLGGALLLVAFVSICYSIGLTIANDHIDVSHLQQVGLVAGPANKAHSIASVIQYMPIYMLGNAMWLFIFTMAWFMNDHARQRRVAEQSMQQQVAIELSFLKNQLNPHFLFNTLNNLYALALKKSDDAPDAILKLSAILRYLLYESNIEKVSFEKEKEIMEAYISLELLRLKDKDNLSFSITADGHYEVPPLLWLPVLENVFKHGTRIISHETFVDYKMNIQANELHIVARNYAPAGKTRSDERAAGIGLANLDKRLALLYPGKHSLRSEQENNQYITEVKIDLV